MSASRVYTLKHLLYLKEGISTVYNMPTTLTGVCQENERFEVIIPANTTDMEVSLSPMTAPKMVLVYGGTGISFKRTFEIGADDTGIPADPVAIFSSENGMESPSPLLFSNSSAQAVHVTIVAFA